MSFDLAITLYQQSITMMMLEEAVRAYIHSQADQDSEAKAIMDAFDDPYFKSGASDDTLAEKLHTGNRISLRQFKEVCATVQNINAFLQLLLPVLGQDKLVGLYRHFVLPTEEMLAGTPGNRHTHTEAMDAHEKLGTSCLADILDASAKMGPHSKERDETPEFRLVQQIMRKIDQTGCSPPASATCHATSASMKIGRAMLRYPS